MAVMKMEKAMWSPWWSSGKAAKSPTRADGNGQPTAGSYDQFQVGGVCFSVSATVERTVRRPKDQDQDQDHCR
jgi:hypothetical protein